MLLSSTGIGRPRADAPPGACSGCLMCVVQVAHGCFYCRRTCDLERSCTLAPPTRRACRSPPVKVVWPCTPKGKCLQNKSEADSQLSFSLRRTVKPRNLRAPSTDETETAYSQLSFPLPRFIIRSESSEISWFWRSARKRPRETQRKLRVGRADYESEQCVRKLRVSAFICIAQIHNP